jgi:hypothetical protein
LKNHSNVSGGGGGNTNANAGGNVGGGGGGQMISQGSQGNYYNHGPGGNFNNNNNSNNRIMVYSCDHDTEGTITLTMAHGKKLDHMGIQVKFFGRIDMVSLRGS